MLMMTASRGLTLLSLICLLLQAAASGADETTDRLRITRIQKEVSADEQLVTVTVSYDYLQPPQATWGLDWVVGYFAEPRRSLELDAVTEMTEGQGRTILQVAEPQLASLETIYLHLGQLDAQYLRLAVTLTKVNSTQVLSLRLSDVSPDLDVGYTLETNTDTEVVITGWEQMGENFSYTDNDLYPKATWVDSSWTLRTQYGKRDLDNILQMDRETRDGRVIDRMLFRTSMVTVNGLITFWRGAGLTDEAKLLPSTFVNYVWEVILVRVHEARFAGPLPDGFAQLDIEGLDAGKADKSCHVHDPQDCRIVCAATANVIDDLYVRYNCLGGRVKVRLPGNVSRPRQHNALVHTTIDKDTFFAGQYECVIASGGHIVRTRPVVVNRRTK